MANIKSDDGVVELRPDGYCEIHPRSWGELLAVLLHDDFRPGDNVYLIVLDGAIFGVGANEEELRQRMATFVEPSGMVVHSGKRLAAEPYWEIGVAVS